MRPAPRPPSGIATCASSPEGTQAEVLESAGGGVLGGAPAMGGDSREIGAQSEGRA
jgi:hypothetical protein